MDALVLIGLCAAVSLVVFAIALITKEVERARHSQRHRHHRRHRRGRH